MSIFEIVDFVAYNNKKQLRPRLHGTGFVQSRHRFRLVCGHIYSNLFFYD